MDFRREGFSPSCSLLMPAWSPACGPPRLPAELRPPCGAFLSPLRARGFGTRLSPDHFRRGITRPVSCYALFKWWLPLSQHPGCLCNSTSLQSTQSGLGTLAGGLGCFPFDPGASPPESDSRAIVCGIRSLTVVGIRVRTLKQPVLYPRRRKREASPKAVSERTRYHRV